MVVSVKPRGGGTCMRQDSILASGAADRRRRRVQRSGCVRVRSDRTATESRVKETAARLPQNLSTALTVLMSEEETQILIYDFAAVEERRRGDVYTRAHRGAGEWILIVFIAHRAPAETLATRHTHARRRPSCRDTKPACGPTPFTDHRSPRKSSLLPTPGRALSPPRERCSPTGEAKNKK